MFTINRIKLAAVTMFIGGVAMAQSDTFDDGKLIYAETGENTCKVVQSLTSSPEEIIIPSTVSNSGKEYRVTQVADNAFRAVAAKKLVIGNNVSIIGERAFAATAIKSLTIPANVDSIGFQAFDACKDLQTLTVEDGDTPIKYYPTDRRNFYTDSLRTLFYGRPLHDTYFSAANATKLETITFGKAVTEIPSRFAEDDTCLVKINWGGNERKIGSRAFYNCKHLKKLALTSSMKEVGSGAFADCFDLESLKLAQGLEIVDQRAFYSTAIKTLTIPASVDTIAYDAFASCKNLQELIVEDGETPIKYDEISHHNIFTDSLRTLYYGRPLPNNILFTAMLAPKLWKVTFGQYVTEIPNEFARTTTVITDIVCKAIVPPIVHGNPFHHDPNANGYKVWNHATLHVPAEAVPAYFAADYWSRFNIVIYDRIQSPASSQGNEALYNLAGQKVGPDFKGIVIRNGKKMLHR